MRITRTYGCRVLRAAVAALLIVGVTNLAQAEARAATRTRAEVTQKSVTIFGCNIFYQEAGTGPAVILLHGLGGDSSNWASTMTPLSEKFHVIALDQIGFGRSEKPLINYRVGTYVDFLSAFMKELKIERASLVGNSLGGWIAAAFALAYPDKVDRLVLVDAAGFALPNDPNAVAVANALNPSTKDGLKQILPLVFYDSKPYASDVALDLFFARKMKAGDGYTTARLIDSIIRGDDVLDNKLSAVKSPTLIVWGREDKLTPLAGGERFKKEIPGSQLAVIDKCGHVPQVEKAAEFNRILLEFLGTPRAAK